MGVEGDGSRPGGGESLKRWRRRRVAVGGVQEGRGAAEGGKQRGERGRERAEGSEREGKTEEGGQRGPGRGRGGRGGEGRGERETSRTLLVLAASAARCCSIRAARPRRIRTAEL